MERKKERVVIHPRFVEDGEKLMDLDLDQRAMRAGWSDDPGVGKAFLLDDGREVLNPVPFAPPIGYQENESMMDVVQRMLNQRLALLADDMEVDESAEDALDFSIPEDREQFLYELEMTDEYPTMPAVADVADKSDEKSELTEDVEDVPIKKSAKKKPAKERADEEEEGA